LQNRTGLTILYVTHDQEVALAISDRIAIIDQAGMIRQIGSPEEIYEQPSDSFVFRFMGVSNFMPLEYRDGQVFVQGSDACLDYGIPADKLEPLCSGGLVAACRPDDVRLSLIGNGFQGLLKRSVYLGSSIDYRIMVGSTEIRVKQGIQEALAGGRLFKEGDMVGLQFLDLKWFSPEEVAVGERDA
jgi:iron(III) transport system ATP-binding protein